MRFRGPSPRDRSPFHARWLPAAFGIGLIAIMSSPVGVAAQCDDDKIRKAAGGASGYHRIDANLCEGIYGKDVSGSVLTFVGLAGEAYFDTYDPLRIGWSAPDGVVHLRAQSWAEQAFQMDASIADAAVLEWAVDLLRTESIPLEQVGLLAWLEEGEDTLYIPLEVSQEPEPDTDADYVFQVLPNARLSEVAVTLAPVEKAGTRPTDEFIRHEDVLPQTRFPMARVVQIFIPRSELPSPGIYFMEILATQPGDSTRDTVTLWFYHGG